MRVEIEKLIPFFKGLSHTPDGKAVIVDGALPGEIVDVEIIKDNKNYIQAKAVDIIKKSPNRIEPICDKFGICGGCELLYMSQECEIKYKDEFYKELFSPFKGAKVEKPVYLERLSSRTRVRFHSQDGKKGFMARGTNDVVDITSCPLLSKSLNSHLKSLVPTKEYREFNFISSIPIKIAENEYFLSNDVFFQSNFKIAEKMLEYVSSQVKTKNVLDAYAGVGFFSKYLEQNDNIKNIIAIEENPLCATFAAKNLSRSFYISSRFEHFNSSLLQKRYKIYDSLTLIVDPPRTGLSKKAISIIAKIAPERIIYVSCNIKSNINDIKYLVQNCNYTLISARLFDMYPATSHMESVAVLQSCAHS